LEEWKVLQIGKTARIKERKEMPVTDKIKAAVERMQDGEKIGASTHFSQPVTKLLDVGVIETNVKVARKTEPEIAEVIEKRDKAIAKARSSATLHSEVIKEQVKEIETRTREELDALHAKLDENVPLLRGQLEHYSHSRCLQRAQLADAAACTAVSMRLARLSSAGLVEAARMAVASADLAAAGCISDEVRARVDLPTSDPRGVSREARAEINALVAQVPSDAAKVTALLAEYDLRRRRALIASGRATAFD
jgi:hypothetical protein